MHKKIQRQNVLAAHHDQEVFCPANFSYQRLEIWLGLVFVEELPHRPQILHRKSVPPRELGLQVARQIFHYGLAPALFDLPAADVFSQPSIQLQQLAIRGAQCLKLALANL